MAEDNWQKVREIFEDASRRSPEQRQSYIVKACGGDKTLLAGFRNGLWNVWWVSRSTKKQQQLTNYTKLNSFVRYPAWSPNDDQIVYEYSETTGNIRVAGLK